MLDFGILLDGVLAATENRPAIRRAVLEIVFLGRPDKKAAAQFHLLVRDIRDLLKDIEAHTKDVDPLDLLFLLPASTLTDMMALLRTLEPLGIPGPGDMNADTWLLWLPALLLRARDKQLDKARGLKEEIAPILKELKEAREQSIVNRWKEE